MLRKKIADGIYKVECEELGNIGNQYLGEMIPMEYIKGLQTACLTGILIPGEDEEDTEKNSESDILIPLVSRHLVETEQII